MRLILNAGNDKIGQRQLASVIFLDRNGALETLLRKSSAMKRNTQDLEEIAHLTLEHYNQYAEEFWQGTRDHDVSQNIAALLRYIRNEPPFKILDFGCGPGRDLKTFAELGHIAIGLEGAVPPRRNGHGINLKTTKLLGFEFRRRYCCAPTKRPHDRSGSDSVIQRCRPMSGLPKSGQGWAIYEYATLAAGLARVGRRRSGDQTAWLRMQSATNQSPQTKFPLTGKLTENSAESGRPSRSSCLINARI